MLQMASSLLLPASAFVATASAASLNLTAVEREDRKYIDMEGYIAVAVMFVLLLIIAVTILPRPLGIRRRRGVIAGQQRGVEMQGMMEAETERRRGPGRA